MRYLLKLTFFYLLYLFTNNNSVFAQINNGTNTLTNNSSSTGSTNTGSGLYSLSNGVLNSTTGTYSVGLGSNNNATGGISIALGYNNTSSGSYSISGGYKSTSSGTYSISLGYFSKAEGLYSLSLGRYVKSISTNSHVIGTGFSSIGYLENNIPNSLMIGYNSSIPTLFISPSITSNGVGKVGIGTTNVNCGSNCDNYRLFVTGGIKTELITVEVASESGWSDYVFNDDYKLLTIEEVEKFITDNKHLPEVPSSEQVVREGIDLGKMDAILLKKIEELTLYIINQQKIINQLVNDKNK